MLTGCSNPPTSSSCWRSRSSFWGQAPPRRRPRPRTGPEGVQGLDQRRITGPVSPAPGHPRQQDTAGRIPKASAIDPRWRSPSDPSATTTRSPSSTTWANYVSDSSSASPCWRSRRVCVLAEPRRPSRAQPPAGQRRLPVAHGSSRPTVCGPPAPSRSCVPRSTVSGGISAPRRFRRPARRHPAPSARLRRQRRCRSYFAAGPARPAASVRSPSESASRLTDHDRIGVFALLLALPVILWQLYAFIVPAFTPREQPVATPLLALAPLLFALGSRSDTSSCPRSRRFLPRFDASRSTPSYRRAAATSSSSSVLATGLFSISRSPCSGSTDPGNQHPPTPQAPPLRRRDDRRARAPAPGSNLAHPPRADPHACPARAQHPRPRPLSSTATGDAHAAKGTDRPIAGQSSGTWSPRARLRHRARDRPCSSAAQHDHRHRARQPDRAPRWPKREQLQTPRHPRSNRTQRLTAQSSHELNVGIDPARRRYRTTSGDERYPLRSLRQHECGASIRAGSHLKSAVNPTRG